MDRYILVAVAGAVLLGGSTAAQAYDPLQRAERSAASAQRFMAKGDTLAAFEAMMRAQALAPDDPEIRAGLAETLFDGGEFEASIRQFEPLAGEGAPPLDRRQALYNAGNAAFELQDFERALESYTGALLASDDEPDDDLLHNLELAQLRLEQQKQEQESSEQSDEESEPQEGEESDESGENQKQPEGEPPPSEDQQQPPESEESESAADSTQQQEPPPPQEQEAAADSSQAPPPELDQMTPEEAMRLLEALDFDEEELRNSIQRRLRGDDEEDEHDW